MPKPTLDRDEGRRITPASLSRLLTAHIRARVPAMVWGPPGVGKSEVAQQVAGEEGLRYIDIRALLMDPVDLRGIPRLAEDGTTQWAAPGFLPPENSTEGFLINLEELPSATPMVQAALYQLVLDRRIGEYRLPDGASVIACGNRVTDGGISYRMPVPLRRRFVHYDLTTEVGEWIRWAAGNEVAVEVLSFIQLRKDLLHDEKVSREQIHSGAPTPRTWKMLSDIFQNTNGDLEADDRRALYAGAVGEGAALEFDEFLRIWRKLPHPRTVLDSPREVEIPKEPSAKLALCGAVARETEEETMGAAVTFAKRLKPELGEFMITTAVRRNPDLQHTRAFVSWAANRSNW